MNFHTGGRGTPCFGCPMLEGGCHGSGTCRMYQDWLAVYRAEKRTEKKKLDVNARLELLEKENEELKRIVQERCDASSKTTGRTKRVRHTERKDDY